MSGQTLPQSHHPRARNTPLPTRRIHLLQKQRAWGIPRWRVASAEPAVEKEAEIGADDMLVGRVPSIRCEDSPTTLRLQLDPEIDFEPAWDPRAPGQADPFQAAKAHPKWVEKDMAHFALDLRPPGMFTVIYRDGARLDIPIPFIFGQPIGGYAMTLFRLHKESDRLIPFQILMDDLRLCAPQKPSSDINRDVPPRFDIKLTPKIWQAFCEKQIRTAGVGFTLAVGLTGAVRGFLRGISPQASPESALGDASATGMDKLFGSGEEPEPPESQKEAFVSKHDKERQRQVEILEEFSKTQERWGGHGRGPI